MWVRRIWCDECIAGRVLNIIHERRHDLFFEINCIEIETIFLYFFIFTACYVCVACSVVRVCVQVPAIVYFKFTYFICLAYVFYPPGGICGRLQRRKKIKRIVHKGIVEFIWIKIIHVQA